METENKKMLTLEELIEWQKAIDIALNHLEESINYALKISNEFVDYWNEYYKNNIKESK